MVGQPANRCFLPHLGVEGIGLPTHKRGNQMTHGQETEVRIGLFRPLKMTAVLGLLLLGGCAGALSHLEVQRRMDATYAGFPPTFAEAPLNQFRATYLSEKAAYDANPDGFLGVDRPGKDCALTDDAVLALADSSFRLPIYERSPSWRDYMKKHAMDYGEPIHDAVTFKLIDGECTGGALNGPAAIVMTYLRLVQDEGYTAGRPRYKVYETTVRENCAYRATRRDGPCSRYTRMRMWDGQFTEDGRLIPLLWAFHEENPDIHDRPEEDDYVLVTTVFDYGRYAGGFEAGPGVAFETTPYNRDKVSVLQNHTLTRMNSEGGRVRYVEYYGGTRKLTYLLRDGVAHGELTWFETNLSGDQRQCFVDGERILTTNCGV